MTIKRVRSFTIKRSKWGRNNNAGEKSGGSLLLSKKDLSFTDPRKEDIGKMCCLGFVCLAYGLSPKQIGPDKSGFGRGLPEYVSENAQKKLPKWLLYSESNPDGQTDLRKLASINDNNQLSDKQKEGRIKRVFARHGIKVKFIN